MTSEETRVFIFYSSKTEPELLSFYADGLAYLKDQDIELEVVDVSESSEKVKEFNVESTPTVIIANEGEVVERHEVVSYLDGVLDREELKSIVEDS